MPSDEQLQSKCNAQVWGRACAPNFESTVELVRKVAGDGPLYEGFVKGHLSKPYSVQILAMAAGEDARAYCDGEHCDCESTWCKHAVGLARKARDTKTEDVDVFEADFVMRHRYVYYRDAAGVITSQGSAHAYYHFGFVMH